MQIREEQAGQRSVEYDRLSGRALERDSCRRLNEHTGRLYINKLFERDKWKSKGVQCLPALLTQFDGSELFEIHNENIHERESKVKPITNQKIFFAHYLCS